MTLRDWFAGMALQGVLANENPATGEFEEDSFRARYCYLQADAMIAERERGE